MYSLSFRGHRGVNRENIMHPCFKRTGKNDFEMQLVGDLTIHGVTKTKTWNITASSESGKLKGKGSVSFPFSDFDMKIPQLFFIISVEDKITLELDFDINIIFPAQSLLPLIFHNFYVGQLNSHGSFTQSGKFQIRKGCAIQGHKDWYV